MKSINVIRIDNRAVIGLSACGDDDERRDTWLIQEEEKIWIADNQKIFSGKKGKM